MAVDYNSTINLPKTEFSMRASLPQKEPELIKKWKEYDLYHKLLEHNEGKPSFILHDGPPYANGDIHLGHALNKLLKDFIVKYKNMSGYQAPYIPGWDTHGLPIERQVIAKYGLKNMGQNQAEFRGHCMDFAYKYINNQKSQFERLGVIGDFEHPYLTLDKEFEATQLEIFGEMVEKGYIYKGLKPVYWCPKDETALAEAEIEYTDDPCKSIYVKFKVKKDNGVLESAIGNVDDIYFVIWTTTTWTLPGNVAVCLGADFTYNAVKVPSGQIYIIAEALCERVMSQAHIDQYEVAAQFSGSELERIVLQHPFLDRDSLVILGDHVTLESGTGCVHTAPGHGVEDFVVCSEHYKELPIIVPVDSKGYLNELAGEFAGLYYDESNKAIFDKLKSIDALLAYEDIVHPYPHCWRCKSPIIFRATEQFFCSVESFKDKAVECAHGVNWLPAWGEDRITSMIMERADWCISRQRIWGVPIPAFYCEKCGHQHMNKEIIQHVADIVRKEGCNAWFTHSAEELLPQGYKCKECGSTAFTKETDIMDVWFDSGSSHRAVLEHRKYHSTPADLYLEGNDQYRGWFQSSLLTSVATTGKAPYKGVITHGMVVDGEGKKMSKSLGNGIEPIDITKQYGADILRLWVASADYQVDVRMSKEILQQLSESYRKIRNTARFILGNLNDFDCKKDMVAPEDALEIDKWAMNKLNALISTAISGYENYEFHQMFRVLHQFCVVDMSNFYLDIIKDRLYIEKADSILRRSAQTCMYLILKSITLLIAPVLSFTADEIWGFLQKQDSDNECVFLNDMPKPYLEYQDEAVMKKWNFIKELREDAKKALEIARAQKVIGASLEAHLTVYTDVDLSEVKDDLAVALIVSKVSVLPYAQADTDAFCGELNDKYKFKVSFADGSKCERCWTYSETVGLDSQHPTLCSRCSKIIGEQN